MVHRVTALASAEGINIGDGKTVRAIGLDEDLALRRNDSAAAAPLGHDEVDEVLHRPGAESCEADVVIAGGEVAVVRLQEPVAELVEFDRVHAGDSANVGAIRQLPPTATGLGRREIVIAPRIKDRQ